VAPPSRPKFNSPQDTVLLEDESGRIKLVGEPLMRLRLVTGVIMAALGVETSAGEFQVVDACFAGMAPQGVTSLRSSYSELEVDQGKNHGM
jgi:DNA polymerase delta subunit 2